MSHLLIHLRRYVFNLSIALVALVLSACITSTTPSAQEKPLATADPAAVADPAEPADLAEPTEPAEPAEPPPRFLEDPLYFFPAGINVVAEDDEYLYVGGRFNAVGFYPSRVLVKDLTTGQVSSTEPNEVTVSPLTVPAAEIPASQREAIEAFIEEHHYEIGFRRYDAPELISILEADDQIFVEVEHLEKRIVAIGLHDGEYSLQWSALCDGGYDMAYYCGINGMAADDESLYVGGYFVGFHDKSANFAVTSPHGGPANFAVL